MFPSDNYGFGTNYSQDQKGSSWTGVRLFLNITSFNFAAVGTLDVKVQVKDEINGQYVDLAGVTFPQKTATGFDDLTVYPGASGSRSVDKPLAKTWRAVAVVGGDASSVTFSLSAHYLV